MSAGDMHVFKKPTDAPFTNRGFMYQCELTLHTWLRNYLEGQERSVCCETEDDIKEIDEALKSLSFLQIKSYGSAFSLADEEIKSSLFNFFVLYETYRDDSNLNFIFVTNSHVIGGDSLLRTWVQDQSELSDATTHQVVKKITEILLEEFNIQIQRKVQSLLSKIETRRSRVEKCLQIEKNTREIEQFESEIQTLINNSSTYVSESLVRENITLFVQRVKWVFENQSPEVALQKVSSDNRSLVQRIEEVESASELIHCRLLTEVYRKCAALRVEDRVLSNALLHSILEESVDQMQESVMPDALGYMKAISATVNRIDQRTERIEDMLERMSTDVQSHDIFTVQELPDGINYDRMTFIAMLESANIPSHSTFKQEFFNAEIAESAVRSKEVMIEISRFTEQKANMLSTWVTQWIKYKDESDGNELLSSVYQRVEDLQDASSPYPVVIKKGMLHQLADNRKLGWVKNYEKRLEGYLRSKEETV